MGLFRKKEKRRETFRGVLSAGQSERLASLRRAERKDKGLEELKRLEKRERERAIEKGGLNVIPRSQRTSVRLSSFITRGVGTIASERARQVRFARQIRSPGRDRRSSTGGIRTGRRTATGGIRTGRRGRPRGSFDPRFARFGGVFGFRKYLSQKLRLERIQAQREARVSPRQELLLQQDRARFRSRQLDPERQPIPNTAGGIPLMSQIEDEINDAARLVR